MSSLFDSKYSQWGNRFLPVAEAYLKLSGKCMMSSSLAKRAFHYTLKKLHCGWLTGFQICLSIISLLSTLNLKKSISKVFFLWNSVIIPKLLLCCTTTIDPLSKGINRKTEQLKSSNWVRFKYIIVILRMHSLPLGLFHGICFSTQQTASLLLPFVYWVDPYFVD